MEQLTFRREAADPSAEPSEVRADLDRIYREAGGELSLARGAALGYLRQTLRSERKRAEAALLADGRGTACAMRLSDGMDEIIRAIAHIASAHVYRVENPSRGERLAIVATGGYGRGTLAPGSDIDLLFLLPYKQTPWGESVVEYVLYLLWDLRLKVGHATRSVDDAMRMARSDMTVRTALLEARFLWGERPLFDQMTERFEREVQRGTGADFVAAKLAERDERVRRAGSSRYLVEPNVKDGKGGLRDLNTLYWIAKYVYRVKKGEDLARLGVFTQAEHARFLECEDFLWMVRCHLHFLTGRAEERLSFDLQHDMADRAGPARQASSHDVERFMKRYFETAKDVGDLTNILCAALEEEHVKAAAGLSRFMRRIGRRGPALLSETRDFVVDGHRLNASDDHVFERDPVNLIRIFQLADKHDRAFHPDLMRLARRSLDLIDDAVRADPEANRLFLEILTSRNDPETTLRRMNEAGVLGRFIPEFGRVVAMMQFNMYHHYTVDEHLIRAVGILAEIDRGVLGDEHPLANELIRTIGSRTALYLAIFLHDVAKGRPEDHSIEGAAIARRLGRRLGLTAAETETAAWLVEHHLLMSMVAQQRDLTDRKTIQTFAATVQSLERLKLLLILTVADIKAVGPGVWNGWKGQLLRTLYHESEPVLAGGHSQLSRTHRVEAARAELRAALSDWSDEAFADYSDRLYPAYWLRVDPERAVAHARLVRAARERGDRLATSVATDAFRAITEITLFAPDHPHLLSMVTGACAATAANIVDAQIFTTADGYALDTFFISREFEDTGEERARADRVTAAIARALQGKISVPKAVAPRRAQKGRIRAFALEPEVLINNAWSDRYTVIEVSGLDRPGLLYDLTTALSGLSLNIASAHVATFGERAVDVFYVTDLVGGKVDDGARETAIRTKLLAALAGEGTSPS